MTKTLAIASDHAGYQLKKFLIENADALGVTWIDLGPATADRVDYPDFGYKLADAVAAGKAPLGVAVCGSGIGISIACNRNPKIRAALCTDSTMARLSRAHNDANVLCMGERLTGQEIALDMVRAFIATEFEGGRHCGRVEKLGKGN